MDPSNFHKLAPITEEEFQIGELKPLSCSVESISDAIVRFLTPLNRSNSHGVALLRKDTTISPPSRRDKAIQRFRNRGTWHRGAWSEDPDNQLEDLNLFFDIFNDVFFSGLFSKAYAKSSSSRPSSWSSVIVDPVQDVAIRPSPAQSATNDSGSRKHGRCSRSRSKIPTRLAGAAQGSC
ncbi:hypothetical protein IFR04_013105 [Cadophora malorum]|uniref:Uncharacterized protein n=1 Tax=Cadophora malorum TaxID=108018 RepID=A0A8H7W1L4_9HELO|nr:hypothetical protein IFR04_013105 [Cadophora malorum]